MLLRDDLGVADGMRMDVEEGHEVVVFIDDMRGYLFLYDLAEDAIFHADILTQSGHFHQILRGRSSVIPHDNVFLDSIISSFT